MFVAMIFHKDSHNPHLCSARAARVAPFKSKEVAIRAIERTGKEGYIKQLGIGIPVWHNVGTL
jgi:hypothetical protein